MHQHTGSRTHENTFHAAVAQPALWKNTPARGSRFEHPSLLTTPLSANTGAKRCCARAPQFETQERACHILA